MKTFSLSHAVRRVSPLLVAALTCLLPAQESLTPTTLAQWQATPALSATGPSVVLPAGAELARSFATNKVTLRLVSRPFFSATPAGLPSVQIGPATLTFMRDKDGGALLLLGDRPLVLPTAIPLAADGRSQATLDLNFDYDLADAMATVAIDGKFFELPVPAPAGSLRVVLTAGDAAPWTLDTLELLSPSMNLQPAEATPLAVSASSDPSLDPALRDALEFHQSMVDGIIAKIESAEAARDRLKNHLSSGGLDPDADFAVAAIDIGQRLIGAGKGEPAEVFFIAAEEALELVLGRTPDSSPHQKALLLQHSALIRGNYLGKVTQAADSLAAAILLQPDNTYLTTTRNQLIRAYPEHFEAAAGEMGRN